MKRRTAFLLVVFAFFLSPALVKAQTLFTYGNKAVSKDEFLKAYSKNATDSNPGEKEYREYLELYIRFKIKVQAALDAKLDTLPTQKAELKGFRSQVAGAYMNDETSLNQLIDEAITRSAKDIKLSHIFVQLSANANAADIKKAQDKINAAHARLAKGESFAAVAATVSEDPAAPSTKGEIGYITVFTLPYDLETLAYQTPAGKFSKPYRSNIGFHIFKNEGERKSAGRIRVSHILLNYGPEATAEQKQQVAMRADSLYKALLNGADFRQLALQFSNDNLSYQNGGEMMEFSAGRYEPAFENAAFALEKNGDLSKPVATAYGYHIIRRIEVTPPVLDKNDKANRENYRQLITQNDRASVTKKRFVNYVLQQTGFKKLPVNEAAFRRYSDSVLNSAPPPQSAAFTNKTPLFSFTKQTVTGRDWLIFLESARGMQSQKPTTISKLYDQFIEATATEYYRDHLEEYNKEFAYQLREFKEGNLLFEIMQRKVWDLASADTVGLKKYYDAHKNNYWWEASADALIFTATNDSIANSVKAKIEANPNSWRELIETSNGNLQGDSARFELGQIPVVERTAFRPGLITASVINETDNSSTFSYIIRMYNNREPRSFNDARGFVINDYQGFLEEKWIAELKKKYPVKVNEPVLATIIKR
jgi:peptidyl-prolyl cis-trans isomerase SurA